MIPRILFSLFCLIFILLLNCNYYCHQVEAKGNKTRTNTTTGTPDATASFTQSKTTSGTADQSATFTGTADVTASFTRTLQSLTQTQSFSKTADDSATFTSSKTVSNTADDSATFTKTLQSLSTTPTKTSSLSETSTISVSADDSMSFTTSKSLTADDSASFTTTKSQTQSLSDTGTTVPMTITPTNSSTFSESIGTPTDTKTISIGRTQTSLSKSYSYETLSTSLTTPDGRVTDSGTKTDPTPTSSDTHTTSLSPDETATFTVGTMTLSETYNLSDSISQTWSTTVSGTPDDSASVSQSETALTETGTKNITESKSEPSLSENSVSVTATANETQTISLTEGFAAATQTLTETQTETMFTPTFSHEATDTFTFQKFPPYSSALEDASVGLAGASIGIGLISTIVGGASPLTVLSAQRVVMLATFRKCRVPDPDYALTFIESPTQLSIDAGVNIDSYYDSEPVQVQKHAAANYAGAAIGNSIIVLGLFLMFYLVAKWKVVSKDRNFQEAFNNIYAPPFLTVIALALWQPTVEGSIGAAVFAYDHSIPHILIGIVVFLLTLAIWIVLFYKTMWYQHYRPVFLWKRVQKDAANARGGLLKAGDWDPFYWHCMQKPMPPPRRTGPMNPLLVLKEIVIYRMGEWRVEDKVLRGVHKPDYIANLPSVDRGSRPLSALMKNHQQQPQQDGGTVSINIDQPETTMQVTELTRQDYFWWRNAHDAFFFFVTDNARWFFIVEWAISMVWGSLNLLARKASCTLGAALLFLPMLVYAVLLIWKRPFCSNFDNATMVALACVLMFCSIFVALAMNAQGLDAFPIFSPDAKYVQTMSILLLIAAILIVIRALTDVYRIWRTWRRDRAARLEAERKKIEDEQRKAAKELEARLLEEEEARKEEEEKFRQQEERRNAVLAIDMNEVEEMDEEIQRQQEEEDQRMLEEAELAAEAIANAKPARRILVKKKKEKKNKKPKENNKQPSHKLLDDDEDDYFGEREAQEEYRSSSRHNNNNDSDDDSDAQYEEIWIDEEDYEAMSLGGKMGNNADGSLEMSKSYAYDYDGTLREAGSISASPNATMAMQPSASYTTKLQRGRKEDEMGVDEEELKTILPEKVKRMYALDRARARALKEEQRIKDIEYEMQFDPDGNFVGDKNKNNKSSSSPNTNNNASSTSPSRKRPPKPLDPRVIHRNQNESLIVPKQSRKVRPKKLDSHVSVSAFLWMNDDEIPDVPFSSHSSKNNSRSNSPTKNNNNNSKPSAATPTTGNELVEVKDKTDKMKSAPTKPVDGKKSPPRIKPPQTATKEEADDDDLLLLGDGDDLRELENSPGTAPSSPKDQDKRAKSPVIASGSASKEKDVSTEKPKAKPAPKRKVAGKRPPAPKKAVVEEGEGDDQSTAAAPPNNAKQADLAEGVIDEAELEQL